jgi:hypothetical protein
MKKILSRLLMCAAASTLLLNSMQVWAQADTKKSFIAEASAGVYLVTNFQMVSKLF